MIFFDNYQKCEDYIDENDRNLCGELANVIFDKLFIENNKQNYILDIYFLTLAQNKYNLLPDFKVKLYSEMLNSRQQMLDLSWIYIYLCDKAEAEAFLDKDIIGNIEETNIIELLSVSELISYILDHFSKKHCRNR